MDVRSPAEFKKAHIPHAFNIPLFNDDERHQVGLAYKKQGRTYAVKTGLRLVQPRLTDLVDQGIKLAKNKVLLLHCWRGGMRSASMAWLFDLAGLETYVLAGGYKSYRRSVLELFDQPFKLMILGGKTGSGKTEMLHRLKAMGQQVIDLEGLANHKGSAFGGIGQQEQPSNEQFENLLAHELRTVDRNNYLWLEDESRKIGKNQLPAGLFRQMRTSKLIVLEMDKKQRILRLVDEYAQLPGSVLEEAILRIEQKLGGLNTKKAIEAVYQGDFEEAADVLLKYYDKTYQYGMDQRKQNMIRFYAPRPGQAGRSAGELIKFTSGFLNS